MSGDYSKDSFDALRDHAGIFLQQGRAVLDDDWNQLVKIFERRIRAGTVDTIGRCVVPRETITGFDIQPGAGLGFGIGRGRLYLDGMLLECRGRADFAGISETTPADPPDPVFDRGREGSDGPEGVLDEMIAPEGSDFLPYAEQPYWPTPDPLPAVDADGSFGRHLVYVVAWQREVTSLENPHLLEPALGGIDTTTRWQTVWQVRVLENVGGTATCATPAEDLAGWVTLTAPSTARLTTATVEIEDPEDPCLVPPTDGYTGIENQFYRVEIHREPPAEGEADTINDQGDAFFKFSRENASVAAAIESFDISGTDHSVTVRSIGRDEILRFRAGDWVEVTDDIRELSQYSGQMLRVARVHDETREIELEGTVDPDFLPGQTHDAEVDERRSRIIRWDQRGVIRQADGTDWIDLDTTTDGLIPVPSNDTPLVLESGITVSFTTAPGAGSYRPMDHWRFAARTAGTQIEELDDAPPEGIQRHYCRLAVLTSPTARLDCRVFWPPEFEPGETEHCGCTVCVTPDSHNSGALTIQAAVDQIGPSGGTVCLEGGGYVLEAPITITARLAITLRGQGTATLLVYRGAGPAIRVTDSVDIQFERFSLIALPSGEDDDGGQPTVHGVSCVNTALAALRRLAVLIAAEGDGRNDHGIAIDGVAIGSTVEECLVVAPIALGAPSANDRDLEGPGFIAAMEIRALDNILFGASAAIRLDGLALNLAGAIFGRNLLLGLGDGVLINWIEPPSGSTAIRDSAVLAGGDAMRVAAGDLRVMDNDISGGPQIGDGIRMVPRLVPEMPGDAQIVGNRVADLAGAGLRIGGTIDALLVKRNVIRRCGAAGILTAPDAMIRHASIDNNLLAEIADAPDQEGAGGIVLTRVVEGRIASNCVRAVGLAGVANSLYAGIAVQGVGSVAVADNAISEVGPETGTSPAVGILAITPYLGLSVEGNRIDGRVGDTSENALGWTGIQIGRMRGRLDTGSPDIEIDVEIGITVPGVSTDELAYGEVGGRAYAVSRLSIVDLGEIRSSQITISGQQIRYFGRVTVPLVLVIDRQLGSVVFGQNQCEQSGFGGGGPASVIISSGRITAGNNVVRHQNDANSMLLAAPDGAAAAIGNLVSAGIDVQPGGLKPQFVPLNLFVN